MSDTEKVYITGIIDGEGSIMLERFHNNQHPAPCIPIASTSIELLEWIKSIVGKGAIKRKKNYNSTKHQDPYTYILRYDNSITLLKDIYPYLIINSKKKRAKLIIEKYKKLTPRNGRYSDELLAEKLKFYEEFISIK